jgi:hypothetical protein
MNITEMEFIRRMSEPEIQSFIDQCTGIVVKMEPFEMGVYLDDVIDKVIKEEASRLVLRQGIERDMAGRFQSRAPMTAVHEGSESPSEILDRVVKKKMLENSSLSYGQALTLAQREHMELSKRIAKELDDFRNRNKK